MVDLFWILTPVLFFIALAYSSVGLGGGSSYLAVLYLFGIPLAKIPPVALFFNIVVSSIAFYRFGKRGHIIPRLLLPLILVSIPATFFGAQLSFEKKILELILAIVFFFISLVLLIKKREIKNNFILGKRTSEIIALPLAALFGFLAGVVGIGGGIFLGPLLLFFGFVSSKQAAGICSAFVLVNSVVGFTAYCLQGRVNFSILFLLAPAVFGGALLGSFLGSKKFSPLLLQKIFAFILLAISLKLGLEIL